MNKADPLDQQALFAARNYMGDTAWPTICLGIFVSTAYLTIPVLVVLGVLPLIIAIPAMAYITYAAYTVLHEAVHGSISGSNKSLRWLNETLGYIMGWILMIPLTAHRHEHLAHHRNTNQPESDPDFVIADMVDSPGHALGSALQVFLGQLRYYRAQRWNRGPRNQDIYLCMEVVAAIIPRVAFFAAGFWLEGLGLFVLAWLLGIALLMFLFAYVVHTPHKSVGRYVDTSTFVIPGKIGKLVTALWGYQNYHSIHHLFPRVPFYHYPDLFNEIEETMRAKGAPIYQLPIPGLLASPGATA
jgi:fatty acid desaturase